MRIVLVQCPAWGALPPLGIASLVGYAREQGLDVAVLDLNIEFHNRHRDRRAALEADGRVYGGPDPWGADAYGQWALDYDCWKEEIRFQPGSVYNDEPLPVADWADRIQALDPDLVGFTTYITSFASSLQLAAELKARRPDLMTVFGGPNTARDREGDIALWTGVVDVAVHGEGELALAELARTVSEGGDLATVPGIGRLVDGNPVWNPPRPLHRPLDDLPFPDFSDLDWEVYENPYLIPLMASRGCVLSCSFCYETVYWERYRKRTPARIVDEIEHQIAHHPLRDRAAAEGRQFYVMFADSLVNGHLTGLRAMCREIVDRGLDIGWAGQATIDKRMDDEVCAELKASGCTSLAVGLESGSPRVLKDMGKKFAVPDAVDVIRRFHDHGMPLTVNVMVGFPTERFRDFVATLRFLYVTRRWLYQVSNVTSTQLALGSELFVHPERFGVTIRKDGSWTSKETGKERHRRRRLWILHRAMRALKIPHQGMAPD